MSRKKIRFISFLAPLIIVFLSADVHAEDVLEKLREDFTNHPALQAENFQVEIKDFKQGFLSLYVPSRSGGISAKKWKTLVEKAESLALKYPEVRDVTWFVKGDGGSDDRLYIETRSYTHGWTAHFHFGGGKLAWAGSNNWDSGPSGDILMTNVDFGKTDWPVLLHFSSQNTTTRFSLTGGTGDRYRVYENSFGIRKYFPMSTFTPYLSGGVTFIMVNADRHDFAVRNGFNSENFMDTQVTSANGAYLNVGIVKKFGKYFEGGIDIKSVQGGTAVVELIENDMSSNSASLFIGWGF